MEQPSIKLAHVNKTEFELYLSWHPEFVERSDNCMGEVYLDEAGIVRAHRSHGFAGSSYSIDATQATLLFISTIFEG